MTITNSCHLQILKLIDQTKSVCKPSDTIWVQKYLGTNKTFHGFSSGQMSQLVKKFLGQNKLNESQAIDLLNSLYQHGTTYTEIALAAMILPHTPIIKSFEPKHLDLWLNYTHGWAENDIMCQSNFSSDILLNNWLNWKKILNYFNKSLNINKRRASLVLLTKSLRQSDDLRLSKICFENIENLKSEKEILITKAVSWALRALTKFHKDEVLVYLDKNKESLPKIAYREALSKALTGKKYVNKSKKQIIT